jgi:hypothetical protein
MEKMNSSGQALLEYVMLLVIVIAMFITFSKKLSESNVLARIQRPFKEDFARTYRYGHPQARGHDDGGPVNIPQYSGAPDDDPDGKNFRIFINPLTPNER